jgi:molybdenum cofactor cytidylyltransferase
VISALLLAAGASRRFGAPKLLQSLGGRPLVQWSTAALCASGVEEVIVVVPPDDGELRAALGQLPVRVVVNALAGAGMGDSIATGVSALGPAMDALLVALGDEPLLSPEHVTQVVERYRVGDAQIVAPTYRGVRGHPVLFDRTVFPELAALTGDRGARAVVDHDPSRVAFLEMHVAAPGDVDTPEDLARLETRHHRP